MTQQFNTATSMGRLMLNMLLSFAQFEREMISERTRDKIAAARRKGKWSGGHAAARLQRGRHQARGRSRTKPSWFGRSSSCTSNSTVCLPVVQELDRPRLAQQTLDHEKGNRARRPAVRQEQPVHLLTNVTYIGKVKYKDEIHDGEHEAIIDDDLWRRVQAKLKHNGRTGGAMVRNKFGALLKGLLHCVPCDCAMTPTHATQERDQAVSLLRLHGRPETRLERLPVAVDPRRRDRAIRRRPDQVHRPRPATRRGNGPPGARPSDTAGRRVGDGRTPR